MLMAPGSKPRWVRRNTLRPAIKVHDLIAKNLWVIGTVGQGPQPVVVKNNVENVFPANKTRSGGVQPNGSGCHSAPEQWFFKA